MNINKEHKETLNILIAYYRKEYSKTDEAYLPKNFVFDEDGLPICSLATLSRLENNKTLGYDKIYFSLIENLHMSYEDNQRIHEIIKEVNLSILKYAEFNEISKITSIISKTLNVIHPYHMHIMYRETIEIYEMIYQYYKDFHFDKAIIDKSIALFHLIDPVLQAVVLDIAFLFYSRIEVDHYQSLYLIKLSKNLSVHSTIKDYLNLIMYFREYNMSKVKELSKKLIKYFEKTKNNHYLCKTYNIYASLYSGTNLNTAINLLEKAVSNFDEEKDFKQNLHIYLRNLATTACMNKNYKLAKDTFEKLYFYDNSIITTIFPYFIYSLCKEGVTYEKIINVLNNLKENEDQIEKDCCIHLYRLYEVKFKIINNQLFLKNILDKILQNKALIKELPSILEIIEDTLFDICKENNTLSIYNDFEKVFNN